MKIRNILIRLRCLIYERPHTDIIRKIIRQSRVKRYCEIGVYCGENVNAVINTCPTLKEVVLVDAYNKIKGSQWFYKEDYILKNAKAIAHRLLDKDKRVRWLEQESVIASSKFKDNYFDMVFIDADHKYEKIKQDILSWYPKIKKGGIISGHDYTINKFGVAKAVNELFDEKNIVLYDAGVWLVKKND